ncbi:NAD(P)/FAD-dependent oxidoreductase [Cohnella sp. JJ-181]|uniref:NAD(P)/FAD-dependent oxidoreductase n=1 Tax=Cohnella rhizoplanae TaxID=2974897 RepID=UPI0022FF8C5F|nr:NAD(P)/FAD-dependent oxidoreductase [Cohnella sp. JJ-181]CAI6085949.1 Thioredoxin reductase [Cohnella sp. JJ-181]
MESLLYDAAIIGGGPAGLNAALMLGRARKNVIVIDEGLPRNRVTHESHGFLTRDGIKPDEFRRIAVEQIQAYPSVRFSADIAVDIAGADGDFTISTRRGDAYHAKKLLFAVGKKDRLPEIEGLTDVYGKSAFVCPYCDGWELRDRPLAVIAKGAGAHHFAKTISGWSDRIALCTDGPDELTEELRGELRVRGIPLYDAPIRRIVSADGLVSRIELQDGASVACTGIFFAPTLVPGSDLPQALGCELTPTGSVATFDTFGKSSVPGVYAAGDIATELYQLITAASMGAMAGAGINAELLAEAWEARGRAVRH